MNNKYDLILSGDKFEPYWLNQLLEEAHKIGLIQLSYLDNSIIVGNIMFDNIRCPLFRPVIENTEMPLKETNLFGIRVLCEEESIVIYHQFFGWMYPLTVKAVRDVLNFILTLRDLLNDRELKNKSPEPTIKFDDVKKEVLQYLTVIDKLNHFDLDIKINECSEDQYTNNVDNLATDQWGGAGPDCSPVLKGVQQNKE